MQKLNQEIVKILAEKLGLKVSTIKKNIYLLRKNYSKLTINAVAQVYATKRGQTVYRKLDKKDKASLPPIEIVREKIKVSHKAKNTKNAIKTVFKYETDDPFIKGHINELNRAYNYKCYTSVFILLRKIVENLIVDILRAKYPDSKLQNKELYFNTSQKRFHDFGIILKNLNAKKHEFGTDNKAVERLYNHAKNLKDDSNDKTHSWFHLVERKSEIENLNANQIFEIIKTLEKRVGIRE